MCKIAIFVEGQTELIVIREFLLRKFNYVVNIECWELFREGNFRAVEYTYTNPIATSLYKIINIGNDQKVLSAILEREVSLFKEGFDRIVGLRDMYSSMYREKSMTINQEVNNEFINIAEETKHLKASNPNKIFLCFSIMEIESWFLALHPIFVRLHENLTVQNIETALNINLDAINPEIDVFHPAAFLNKIYDIVNMSYDKQRGDIEAICKILNVEDFEHLLNSPKCQSFNTFNNAILNVA